jgi:hypothetical protein
MELSLDLRDAARAVDPDVLDELRSARELAVPLDQAPYRVARRGRRHPDVAIEVHGHTVVLAAVFVAPCSEPVLAGSFASCAQPPIASPAAAANIAPRFMRPVYPHPP